MQLMGQGSAHIEVGSKFLQYLLSFVGHTVRNQYDMLQKHRINLTDEEMSEFTELFKVIQ